MRRTRLSIVLALAVLAGGASLAAAAEEPVTPQDDPGVASEQKLLPEELRQILTPEPMEKAPIERYAVGPCSVSVICSPTITISCSSPAGSSCRWRENYSAVYYGYVKCGSYMDYCG